jgi:hypothetical protein
MDLHALIADAQPPARTVELCLRGDLVADLEQVTRDLALAQSNGDAEAVESLTERATAVRRYMAAAVIVVRFEAIHRRQWLALLAEHPPREDDATDARVGFNTATLYEAIVRRSWVAPELDPADLDALLDAVNDGQFNALADAAFSVNTRGAVVPFGWRDYSSPPS